MFGFIPLVFQLGPRYNMRIRPRMLYYEPRIYYSKVMTLKDGVKCCQKASTIELVLIQNNCTDFYGFSKHRPIKITYL